MIFAQQSTSYESTHDTGITGLVGIFEVMVVDNDGNIVTASSPAGIIETPAGSGIYAATRVAPGDTGQYSVIGSTDGTYDPGTVSVEDLIVGASVGVPLEPLPPISQVGAPAQGPCSAWATPELIAECCAGTDVGTNIELYEDALAEASEYLWLLSGKRYSGSCQMTHARPCGSDQECGVQRLPNGHVIGWEGRRWEGVRSCGCSPLQAVPLSGYPVREIVEVLIDGVAVDPETYEIQRFRELVRMNDPDTGATLYWPSCQNMARQVTEDGTFAVTYTYGLDPPRIGQRAAADLACQIFRSCNPEGDSTSCDLPAGVTRITRNGVVIERQAFGAWAYNKNLRLWRSGIPSVDGFLNAVNPNGLRRRPAFASPDGRRYARAG
jgi:hypothetical protein